jgi:hypothetical protein
MLRSLIARPSRNFAWIAGLIFVVATVEGATDKFPLYGDPAHPNISGMWDPEYAIFLLHPPPAAELAKYAAMAPAGPKLTPAYKEQYEAWRKEYALGKQAPDTVTRCLAFGFARFGTMPMEIIQTPGQITMNLGVLHDIRRIYLDGTGHTVGADPSFNGDSVGHWDGDTLVVETNNIRAATLDRDGVPYSDALTAVEKIRRVSATKLEVQTTLTDPKAFEEPYKMTRTFVEMPHGSRFEEYICENNKDLSPSEK